MPNAPEDRDLQQPADMILLTPFFIILQLTVFLICGCLLGEGERGQRQRAAEEVTNTPQHAIVPNVSTTSGAASIPILITATAPKFCASQTVGVNFTGTDHAKVSSMDGDSIFKETRLVPGMKVVSINNVAVNSKIEALRLIRESSDIVTVLAHDPGYYGQTENLLSATIRKELPDQSNGVAFKTHPSAAGKVIISRVEARSPFIHTDIAIGMEIVAINNAAVQSATRAAELTRQVFPLVTLLARRSAAIAVAIEDESSAVLVPAEALIVDATSPRLGEATSSIDL